jgi:spoIIIJ-associated protein
VEWVESTGKTIEEAKDVALDRLGVHEDDAEFEVVADVTTGLFGRVKEEARVRARVRPTTPRSKDEGRRRQRGGKGRRGGGGGSGGKAQGRNQGGSGKGDRDGGPASGGDRRDEKPSTKPETSRTSAAAPAGDGGARGDGSHDSGRQGRNQKEKAVIDEQPTMSLPEQADIAQAFVSGLAEEFGTTVTFERTEVDEDIHLTVSGDDLGRMIGRRGSTASAIDELVRTVLQRQAGSSRGGRIRLDIGGVRARRAEALTRFCRDLAQQVRESGVSKALEPMNGADRKIVHDVINDEDGVDTVSEGEDPNRRVVIVPTGDAD